MTFLYILLAIFAFGVMIAIHELGHFLMARAFGVGIYEFSIGMGPKLFSWNGKKTFEVSKKQELDVFDEETGAPRVEKEVCTTKYSFRLLPIGGYVNMVGEDEEDESPDSFNNKKVWQRILITVAGPLTNVILGFLLMMIVVISTPALASGVVSDFREGATSYQYGLQAEDEITHVNGVRTRTGNEVLYEINNNGYQPLDLTVLRNGEVVELKGVVFPGIVEQGVAFGQMDFRVYAEEKTFGNVIKHSFFRSVSTVKMVFDQLGDMLTGRYGINAVSGPVGATEVMVSVAKSSIVDFLYLVVVISINLGIFNLLPIPALDGGRLLFLLIEAVIRRPLNKNVEGYIHFVGMMLLLLFMAFIMCKDIAGLFV